MRESLIRSFVSFFGRSRQLRRAIPSRRASRQLGFQALESRELFSADEIVIENALSGAIEWQVRAPLTEDIKDANGVVIRAKERDPRPDLGTWNGFVDSDQDRADRIQGFTTKVSYDLGELNLTIDFKVDCPNGFYDIEIYRLGYYGSATDPVGTGARLVAKIANGLPRAQPALPAENSARLREANNWVVSDTWAPEKINGRYYYRSPTDVPQPNGTIEAYPLLSGVYYAKLKRADGAPYSQEKASAVVFVLTDKASQSDVVFQTADASWQAYNTWGDRSIYYHRDTPSLDLTRAFAVSYDRPYDTITPVIGEELQTIRFLEQNGYDVTYTTHVDVDRYYNENSDAHGPGSLRNHDVYIVGGHDEYWSGEHVKALEAARSSDVSLMFLTGNEGFWKTRWENDYQWLVCYKETQNNGQTQDPTNIFTGLCRDLRTGDLAQGVPFNAELQVTQPENVSCLANFRQSSCLNWTGRVELRRRLG